MQSKCVVCGSLFISKTDKAKYCCVECKNHSRFKRTNEQIKKDNEDLKKKILELYALGFHDGQISRAIGKSNSWTREKRVELGLPKQDIKKKKIRAVQLQMKICKECGAVFIPKTGNQLFCSLDCQHTHSHNIHDIKRKRKVKGAYIDDISLSELYKRDKGICHICGGKCDYSAIKYVNGKKCTLKDYPSRDHIRPLSRGGLHSWNNVKLAHIGCNSSKGVNYG